MKTDIHIFSPGVQTSAQGVTREFTKGDLAEVALSYNSEIHEAPIRIGHEDNDKVPSWGWVKQVKMKGDDLFAEVEFSPLMEDYVKNGLYKKVSASFYSPESKINPDPGQWSLRHVAMLGAQPPAVKGLKGFAYAEESSSEGVLDFAVEMKLSPDQVFDDELGPTLTVDQHPAEFLKEQLEEARQQMAEEKKRDTDAQMEIEAADDLDNLERPDSDFAEDEKDMKKKPSKAKQGAEDAEEEEDGEDTVDSKELPPALKEQMEKKKAEAKDKDDDKEEDTSDNQEATFEPAKKKRGHDGDKSSDVGIKEDSKYEEADEAEHKEKMDAVGKEDGDIDNDGDEDSSDEYLAKRRKAIKASIKSKMKKSDYAEEDSVDHAGCDSSKKKNYKEKYMEDDAKHSEVSVPEGVDAAQWEAGFKDGVDKFYAAAEAGEDEVMHEEAEDQSDDYLSGIEAGFEFAQGKLENVTDKAFGVDKTGKGKDCHADECLEGKGESDDRDKKGTGKEEKRDTTSKDGGAQEKDRQSTGKGKEPFEGQQAAKPSTVNVKGSGKQVKNSSVRVMSFNESDFSELAARLEQLEAANAKLVAEKQAAEARAHRMQLNDFAESLYNTGRLTNAMIDQDDLVDYMEGLENGTLEFSEGETAATKLMDILAALPQQVEFSEIAAHDPEAVPVENLDPHERALRMSKEQDMSYAEALKQTLFSVE